MWIRTVAGLIDSRSAIVSVEMPSFMNQSIWSSRRVNSLGNWARRDRYGADKGSWGSPGIQSIVKDCLGGAGDAGSLSTRLLISWERFTSRNRRIQATGAFGPPSNTLTSNHTGSPTSVLLLSSKCRSGSRRVKWFRTVQNSLQDELPAASLASRISRHSLPTAFLALHRKIFSAAAFHATITPSELTAQAPSAVPSRNALRLTVPSSSFIALQATPGRRIGSGQGPVHYATISAPSLT